MGITGLIPFLEKASKRGNISQFSGGTVAIDSYCWLHKGAFSCADKLSLGEPTNAYVKYCMKFVSMLLANRIKPILVFDGRHLPAKADTESKRREARDTNRRRAAELMRTGHTAEGRNLLRRSVDITHEMALELIKECQERNVDCIVAPYEADAQLAYLNISGIADVVITEDSDLTLFGCTKIFFKMDINGNGVLVEQDRIHLAMGVRSENFDMEKFRHMCILSGCDYLASLPGIGLSKACKFITKTADPDIHRALTRMPSYLNMKSLDVSKDYRDAFLRALVTFKHQLVFCPMQRKQVRLYPTTPDVTPEQLHYAGQEMPPDVAWQLALGNYDPFTLKKLHNFDPDNFQPGKKPRKTNSWNEKPVEQHPSIWSTDYKMKAKEAKGGKQTTLWPTAFGKVATLKTTVPKPEFTSPKRNYDEVEELTGSDMLKIYANDEPIKKKMCNGTNESCLELDSSCAEEEQKSPILMRRSNPFAKKTSPIETSPSLLKSKSRTRFGKLARFKPTVLDSDVVTESKFFTSVLESETETNSTEPVQETIATLQDLEVKSLEDNKKVESEESRNFSMRCNSFPLSGPDREHTEITDTKLCCLREVREPYIENVCENENPDISTKQISGDSSYEAEKPLRELSNNMPVEVESITSIEIVNYALSNSEITARTSSLDSALGYSVNSEGVNNLKSSLFKWANPKANGTMRRSNSTPVTRRNSYKDSQQSQATNSRIGDKPAKRAQLGNKKASLEQGQQCVLSMFGFQKKTVLKH